MNGWWHDVWNTLQGEFSDLSDVSQWTRVAVRLVVAALLGGVLGYEREHTGKQAGMRTHMLVALGAALVVLVPQLSGFTTADQSRIIQGLVTGIGFLGAGTIVKGHDLGHVKGLTTAAGIWATCAIGVAVGLGREASAVLGTVLALVILALAPQQNHHKDTAFTAKSNSNDAT